MKTLRFGIELEYVGATKEALARAIHGAVGGHIQNNYGSFSVIDAQGLGWKVVADGSLSDPLRSGEIVSPPLGYEDIEKLQNVVRAVRAAGGRADETCGLHLHVDGVRFDANAVVRLVKMVNKQERIIEKALGISQARLNRYCKPIDQGFLQRIEARKPRNMVELKDAWYGVPGVTPSRYNHTRYSGLNLNSLHFRGTFEFRWFGGSNHAGEVKAYVQFVLALCKKALDSKAASSKKREYNEASAKYDFRVFLNSISMAGPEFKTARLHLLKRLGGSAAWKNGRPARLTAVQPTEEA